MGLCSLLIVTLHLSAGVLDDDSVSKKRSEPSVAQTLVPNIPTVQQPVRPAATNNDPYLSLAEALAQTAGGDGKINVGIGNFVYEDTDLLSPYSAMLKDEMGIALPKVGKFEVITRERLADLQNEGKFQAKDIVEPGTEAKKVQIEGVQGMIRGRFYYQPPNLTIYAEIAYLDGGETRKVKVIVPANEVATRIRPSDAQRQSEPEVAIAPQALKESIASIADVSGVVKQFNHDFDLQVNTTDGKRGYAAGENVSFRVRSSRDCFIAVIDKQIDGKAILLFPNVFYSDNYLSAGKAIDVPGTVKHGFAIKVSAPFGSDVIQVIACTRNDALQRIVDAFPASTEANPYTTRTRGIIDGVITRGMNIAGTCEDSKNTSLDSQSPQWAEDHIVISSYPRLR
jgi:hypothetical protein